MSAPAATVVIPTYNRRVQVRRAVESVLAQSRPDFELVVIDDGSTDGTADSLGGLDPRIRVVRQGHRGVAAARNAGARHGRAPVIAFLDSDNVWLPDHLSTVLEMLAQNPAAVLASTCPRFVMRRRQPVVRTQVLDILPRSILAPSTGFTTCIAVRREAFERAGGFDEGLAVFEDSDLWVRIAIQGPFALLRRRTIIRNETTESLTTAARSSGLYLPAIGRHAERLAELLSATPGREWLAPRARANALMAEALLALDAGEQTRFGDLLAEACALAPELQDEPGLIAFRVVRHLRSVRDAGSYARASLQLADAWPDQSAFAAHWMRAFTIVTAARAGQLGLAFAALRGWRRTGSIEFLRRELPGQLRRRLGGVLDQLGRATLDRDPRG